MNQNQPPHAKAGFKIFEFEYVGLLCALLTAAFIRLFLIRHGNSETCLYFFDFPDGLFTDKHSLIYPLIKCLLYIFGIDPISGLFSFNSVVGIATVVPFFYFVLNRADDRAAAFIATMLLAIHPIIARESGTDSHFPLLLFFWFTGLALLSSQNSGDKRVFTGLLMLGLASSMRIEGVLYVAASVPLLGMESLKRIFKIKGAATAGLAVIAGLVMLQFFSKSIWWHPELRYFTVSFADALEYGWTSRKYVIKGLFWPAEEINAVLPLLFIAGIAVCIFVRRFRWGLWVLAAWIMVEFVMRIQNTGIVPTVVHRTTTGASLKCIIDCIAPAWIVGVAGRLRFGKTVAWLATGAAILTVILPANSREFYGHEYAFNTEFEIYRLLRDPDITGGQNQCTVLFRHPYNDIGIANPKVIAPMHRYVKCEEDGNCLKEALKGGCVYYFRTAQCYYAPKNWLDPDAGAFPPNKICSAIEREYQLVPVKEARVDIISTNGSMEGLRENGVIGLYKVLAGKK